MAYLDIELPLPLKRWCWHELLWLMVFASVTRSQSAFATRPNLQQVRSTSLPHKPPFGKAMCSCNFRLFTQVDTCVWGKICHRAANGVIIWRCSDLFAIFVLSNYGPKRLLISWISGFFIDMSYEPNNLMFLYILQLLCFSSRGTREQAVMWWPREPGWPHPTDRPTRGQVRSAKVRQISLHSLPSTQPAARTAA